MSDERKPLSLGAIALRELVGDSRGDQAKACDALDVHSAVLSRLLRGEREPSLEVAIKIRDVFGIDPSLWMRRQDEQGAA